MEQSRTPVNGHGEKITPLGVTDCAGLTDAPMGLEYVCIPLQGLRSASPRYTPAYDLAAPNGALPGTNEILWSLTQRLSEATVQIGIQVIMS